MSNDGKGLSIGALVCGIISCVLAWFYMVNIVALILGIVGLVLAVNGRKLAKAANAPTGIGTAGLVLAIIGTSLAGIGFLSCTVCVACAANATNDIINDLNALY